MTTDNFRTTPCPRCGMGSTAALQEHAMGLHDPEPTSTDSPDFFDHRYGRFGPERVKAERDAFHAEQAATREADRCQGGTCQDINRLCSKHSMEYQLRFGRASNE